MWVTLTLIFRPPIMAPFICSSASCAPSGISYSTNANPLCFCVIGSHDMLIDLIGPNGKNAARIVSSFNSNEILPTYTLQRSDILMSFVRIELSL